MRKPELNASNDKGGPRTRLGARLLAGVATLSLVASMCPGTAALAFANEQYQRRSGGEGRQGNYLH